MSTSGITLMPTGYGSFPSSAPIEPYYPGRQSVQVDAKAGAEQPFIVNVDSGADESQNFRHPGEVTWVDQNHATLIMSLFLTTLILTIFAVWRLTRIGAVGW